MRRLSLMFVLLSLAACQQAANDNASQLGAALGGQVQEGFARAIEPREFRFPRDHAAHPRYRNEWWYITGNVRDEAGHHYGYQVTLFRIALAPEPPASSSEWATNQVWMAHAALTDVAAQDHRHAQRLSRGAVGLAGQGDDPFRVWLEDWQILGGAGAAFPWQISVATADFELVLEVTPRKPVVLQGEAGLSRKSDESGNASYYYSFTRLQTRGEIRHGGARRQVRGWSWLDREWSTSALAEDQAGWDWFSLQLTDDHDLMFYRLRKHNGETDPNSMGAWVDPDGEKRNLYVDDVQLEPVRYWTSPEGQRYPVQWRMQLPALGRQFSIEALVDDQQMTGGVVYWEGAVEVTDPGSGEVLGHGYLEMSGY